MRGLACLSKLAGHSVTVFTDTVREIDALAERFREADALVLIRERTRIGEALLERLPRLKLISQTGKGTAHIDLAACARRRGATFQASQVEMDLAADLVGAPVRALARSGKRAAALRAAPPRDRFSGLRQGKGVA